MKESSEGTGGIDRQIAEQAEQIEILDPDDFSGRRAAYDNLSRLLVQRDGPESIPAGAAARVMDQEPADAAMEIVFAEEK